MNNLKSNWLNEIKHHRKKVYSQCGEEGFIEFILDSIGVEIAGMNIIEFGAGDGVSLSNSKYFTEKGAIGYLYDGDTKGAKNVNQVWLNRDVVTGIALDMNKSGGCDLLLVDVDGNDYWFIRDFLEASTIKPKLIVCEINPIWKRDEAMVIPYNENHVWGGDDYYGMSLAAVEMLMYAYDYTLIFVNDSLNAYFIPTNLVGDQKPTIEYRVKKDHPHNKVGEWIKL